MVFSVCLSFATVVCSVAVRSSNHASLRARGLYSSGLFAHDLSRCRLTQLLLKTRLTPLGAVRQSFHRAEPGLFHLRNIAAIFLEHLPDYLRHPASYCYVGLLVLTFAFLAAEDCGKVTVTPGCCMRRLHQSPFQKGPTTPSARAVVEDRGALASAGAKAAVADQLGRAAEALYPNVLRDRRVPTTPKEEENRRDQSTDLRNDLT